MNHRLLLLASLIATPSFAAPANTDVPVEKNGPYARVFYPQNLPNAADKKFFAHDWSFLGANPQHNAAFYAPAGAPAWLTHGVAWRYAEARAWPLENKDSFDSAVYGARRGPSTQTQFYGNADGVSLVEGIVYAESDDQFAYAVNARTGKLIWRTSPVGNTLMGTPVVAEGKVFLSAGNVGFNFSNVAKLAKTKTAARGEGISFNGIYALDARSGALLWHYGTDGEAMPTPAYGDGTLFITTGDGYAHAVSAKDGKLMWKTELKGMANMSSPALVEGKIYVAMSSPGGVFCLDATSGKVLWQGSIQGAEDTGIGDVSPAVSDHIVVMDAVADAQEENGKSTIDTRIVSYDADSGKILWQANMGRGPKPPAFKGGVPMIHEGVVYIGTPVNDVLQAYDLKTGEKKWSWTVPDAGAAGAARGAATYYHDILYVATGENVYALNPKDGHLLHSYHVGGRFGIVNPVIAGGTMYLSNSWDWLIALPLNKLRAEPAPMQAAALSQKH